MANAPPYAVDVESETAHEPFPPTHRPRATTVLDPDDPADQRVADHRTVVPGVAVTAEPVPTEVLGPEPVHRDPGRRLEGPDLTAPWRPVDRLDEHPARR